MMNDAKKAALAAVEQEKELLEHVSDSIWEYAELSLQEYKSAALLCQVLEQQGFAVEQGICGIETAFSASYGSGKPVIGILAEYDALSGLSQQGGCTEKMPLIHGGTGHGCGHNMLGAGALGAALMTGTTYTRKFIDGLAETIPNHALEALLHKNLTELGAPSYTPEELAFADAVAATFDGAGVVPGSGQEDPAYAAQVKALQGAHAMNDFVMSLYTGEAFCPGSTDVGDVSWQCPTAQLHIAAWPNGCPGHSWQNVSCGKSALGHKAVVHAGKVLCAAVIDLLTQEELLVQAKAEFAQRTAASYSCPIPPEAVPTIPE